MEKLFINLPFFLKNIAFGIVSLMEKRKRKGKYYLQYKTKLIESVKNDLTAEDIIKDKAIETVNRLPYYKGEKIKSFNEIPIIDKNIINNHYCLFFNTTAQPFTEMKTSGTSGQSLKIPLSKKMYQKKFAAYDAFRELNEMCLKEPNANFFGRTIFPVKKKVAPFWLYSSFSKQLVLSQYHLNENTVNDYLDALSKYGIKWIHGYPSFLNLFSELLIEGGLVEKCRDLKISKISTGSETLLSFQKQNIEKVFGCEVLDFYGQGENVAHIFSYNNELYVDKTFSYVEFVHYKDDLFHIIGTQVDNECLPFIRYNTGDLARINDQGKIIEIIGRIEDYIYLKDDTKISRLDHIFKSVKNLREAKIIQEHKGSAKFLINPTNNFTDKDYKELRESIMSKLGNDFIFKIEKTSHIPKTKMGKLKFVERLVK